MKIRIWSTLKSKRCLPWHKCGICNCSYMLDKIALLYMDLQVHQPKIINSLYLTQMTFHSLMTIQFHLWFYQLAKQKKGKKVELNFYIYLLFLCNDLWMMSITLLHMWRIKQIKDWMVMHKTTSIRALLMIHHIFYCVWATMLKNENQTMIPTMWCIYDGELLALGNVFLFLVGKGKQ